MKIGRAGQGLSYAEARPQGKCPAFVTANCHWSSLAGSLPVGLDLASGWYRIWAYAFDNAGNRSASAIQVTVS
jgi:hypothetical protein